jgi:drug/metabolite transporter, DME family
VVPHTRAVSPHSARAEERRTPWRGLVLLCAAGVIWGTIGPAVHVVDDRSAMSVWVVGGYRALAAVVVLLLAVATTGRAARCRRLLQEHAGRAVAVGVLTATFMLLFFVSVVSVGVSIATVVALGWAPVLLQLVRIARDRRAPPLGEALTVGAAVVGLLLISLAGAGDSTASRPALGVVLAFASGTAYAFSADLVGPLNEHDGLTLAAVTMTVAAVVLVLSGTAVAVTREEAVTTGDLTSWLLVIYLGVGTMALAYVLLYAGLRTTPSRTAVVATLLEPVTAVVIAVVLLGEHLTPAAALGSLLILAAIGSLGLRPAEPAPQ